MRRAARRPLAAALGLLVFGAAAACNTVLGIDGDYLSVIEKFCQCDWLDERWVDKIDAQGVHFFECADFVTAAFERDPGGGAEWLAGFEKHACEKCSEVSVCLTTAPVCLPDGAQGCGLPGTCCGYDPADPWRHYCGYVVNEQLTELTTQCFSDAQDCRQQLEECGPEQPCCGALGQLSSCTEGLCYTMCDSAADPRCPGCCSLIGVLDAGGAEIASVQVCLTDAVFQVVPELAATGVACGKLCVDNADCAPGVACKEKPYSYKDDDFQIRVCE